jgi:hypothetical protein
MGVSYNGVVPTFWLSMHVPYTCRHVGACCSSGWPIPLERSRVAALRALRSDGSWLLPAPEAPPEVAGVLAVSASGHCVFHREGCDIQRAFGHRALPAACQHFPREVLIDRRGVFVTLSHYCPTAADLLFDHRGPVEIVEGPPAIPEGDPEGLDARDVLPPLLRDGVLMDDEACTAWERHMIWMLTRDDGLTPEAAVASLRDDLAVLQRWRPGTEPLVKRIAILSQLLRSTSDPGWQPLRATSDPGWQPLRATSDPAWQPLRATSVPGPTSVPDSVVVRRYLAARAFASWMAYQGNGVSAVIRSLELTLSVLRQQIARIGAERAPTRDALKAAIRQTDLLLVHEMPRDELARRIAL